MFKKRLELKLHNGPAIQLQRLPMPHELSLQQPALWQALFSSEQPSSQPPISTLSIQSLASSIPLRSSNQATRLQHSSMMLPAWQAGGNPHLQAMMAGMLGHGMFMPQWQQHRRADPEIPTLYRSTSRSQFVDPLPERTPRQPLAVMDRVLDESGEEKAELQEAVKKEEPEESDEVVLPCKPKPIAEVTTSLIKAMNQVQAAKKDANKASNTKVGAANVAKSSSSKKTGGKADAPKHQNSKKCAGPKPKKPPQSNAKSKTQSKSVKQKWSKTPPKDLIAKFKAGCSKCRFAVGCTPSCWKQRGF